MSLSLGRSMRHASASGLMRQLTLACASNQAPIKSQTTTSNQRHEARHRRSCRLHSSLAACSAPPSRASPASIPPFVSGVTGAQRSSALKAMLKSDKLEFIMEAHSGLSAKIVQESGFSGIWASGLSISAAMGYRDSNEASYTQVLQVCEFMTDNTQIPVLLDADTGYGNFNNARMLVRKLEQRGIAGACIEDKLFPKTNSLLDVTNTKPLASIDEFAAKIRAMKDTQQNPDFCVVARIESFIAGWPLEEALKRADAYATAGADALLIHSKLSNHSEIEAFCLAWDHSRCPVVIVPTKYYTTHCDVFRKWKVSLVIWANHNLRSSITAMQETSRTIFDQQSLSAIEPKVASVKEVFRLQNQPELEQAEKKYLPKVSLSSK